METDEPIKSELPPSEPENSIPPQTEPITGVKQEAPTVSVFFTFDYF